MGGPFFSIIVPMHNREAEVGRSLRSCVEQTDGDFEVVVVDDGSRDGSVRVARSVPDARIRVLTHERNRGACAARNTAARDATGEWLVFLDSDDELEPSALAHIRHRIATAPEPIDKLLFSCRTIDGQVSPFPALPGTVWGYDEYVGWLGEQDQTTRSEALPVTRRVAFLTEPYGEGHALEGLHELNFSRQYRVFACPDVVRIYHQDAAVRVVRPTTDWLRSHGEEFAQAIDRLVELHGAALARRAPRILQQHRFAAAYYHFFGRNRRLGLRKAAEAFRHSPLSPKLWILAILGTIGPAALSLAVRARR